MGHLSKIFDKVPVEVQKRNGFDLSHIFVGSAKCGQLTPVLKRLLMPATKFSLGCSLNVELPPLATSFFGRIDAVVEVFFCPCSLLYGGFKQFISNQIATMFPASQDAVVNAGGYALPVVRFTAAPNDASSKAVALDASNDGLSDFFGLADIGGTAAQYDINMLPYLAYHCICSRFYRNTQVTKDWFAINPNVGFDSLSVGLSVSDSKGFSFNKKNVSLVHHSFYTNPGIGFDNGGSFRNTSYVFETNADLTFPDGVHLLQMRQRPWARDYFTSALLSPQQGGASTLEFSVDVSTPGSESGAFTIQSLRAANSLQKFLEANNLDQSYAGVLRSHFGVHPSDADLDTPMYIGRVVVPVYQKTVSQNSSGGYYSADDDAYYNEGADSPNPFVKAGMLGASGAKGGFSGEGSITQSFKVTCFGYLMGLFSLVPHTMYNYGWDKDMMRTKLGDFPFPELQSVGMEPIKNYEIYAKNGVPVASDWAYTQRYAYEKYINDTSHGELRPGKSLESFVLQRSFASAPAFATQFTLIPQNALDGVLSVNTSEMNLTCWFEIFWVFKSSMPLAEYCIPTLGDLKDTYTVHVAQGGSKL